VDSFAPHGDESSAAKTAKASHEVQPSRAPKRNKAKWATRGAAAAVAGAGVAAIAVSSAHAAQPSVQLQVCNNAKVAVMSHLTAKGTDENGAPVTTQPQDVSPGKCSMVGGKWQLGTDLVVATNDGQSQQYSGKVTGKAGGTMTLDFSR
jgi:hypothetical protein